VKRFAVTVLIILSTAPSAIGRTPACAALDDRQRQVADEILGSEYLYDCCDDTISRCLEARPDNRLAVLVTDDVCRRVAAGETAPQIRRALSRRARSMVGGGAPAEVDLAAAPVFGRSDAPVTVVIYACARCPYCSKLVPALYEAVDDGPLHNDARLAFRVFPIRGHEGSTEAGLAFAAAAAMDRFWPFMLYAYRHFDEFTAGRQLQWAQTAGLDPDEFAARLEDPATREALVASKKEGLVNGVEETPTLLINGRRWVADLEIEEIESAVEEEAARVRGDLCGIE